MQAAPPVGLVLLFLFVVVVVLAMIIFVALRVFTRTPPQYGRGKFSGDAYSHGYSGVDSGFSPWWVWFAIQNTLLGSQQDHSQPIHPPPSPLHEDQPVSSPQVNDRGVENQRTPDESAFFETPDTTSTPAESPPSSGSSSWFSWGSDDSNSASGDGGSSFDSGGSDSGGGDSGGGDSGGGCGGGGCGGGGGD